MSKPYIFIAIAPGSNLLFFIVEEVFVTGFGVFQRFLYLPLQHFARRQLSEILCHFYAGCVELKELNLLLSACRSEQ